MEKTKEQLQSAIDREIAYTRKANDKNMRLMEENRELKRRLAECELKLSEIKHTRNERGAGRKRVATKEVMARAMKLRSEGLSQIKIAEMLSEQYGIKIGRTTVGDIVRGEYAPLDE
jgi:hypothetical protein